MYYSYVMGIDNSINRLSSQGFSIEKDGDNYMVTFPDNLCVIWEDFIAEHLKIGFWNEYIAKNKVVFIFRLTEGIKRYEVDDFQNNEVLTLCEKLCGCKFTSLKKMLCDNHFYSKII